MFSPHLFSHCGVPNHQSAPAVCRSWQPSQFTSSKPRLQTTGQVQDKALYCKTCFYEKFGEKCKAQPNPQSGLGRVSGLGSSGLRFRAFRVWGFGFRVQGFSLGFVRL